MLHRSKFLILAWVCGFFFVTAIVCDSLKALGLNAFAVVSIVVFPIALSEIGMICADEGPRWQKIGYYLQIVGSLLYVVLLAAGWYSEFSRHSKALLPVTGFALLCVVVPILAVLNALQALRTGREFEMLWAETLDSIAMAAIGVLFTASAVFIMRRESLADSLIGTAIAMFFGGCTLMSVLQVWTRRRLETKPKTHNHSAVNILDAFMLMYGASGAMLVVKACQSPMNQDSWYALIVGVLVLIASAFYILHQVLIRSGRIRSYIAASEGLLEIHPSGWILYRWDQILSVARSSLFGVERILIVLNAENEELRKGGPNFHSVEYQKWQNNCAKRRLKYLEYEGVDLVITHPTCRFGIVDLWHGIQLSFAEPSQASLLPSVEYFIHGGI